jgi:hypothetical protein
LDGVWRIQRGSTSQRQTEINIQYENGTVRTIVASTYRYDTSGRVFEKKIQKIGFRHATWRYTWDDHDRLTETQAPEIRGPGKKVGKRSQA